MLESLKLYNFKSAAKPAHSDPHDYYVLETCQRTLVLSHGVTPNFECTAQLSEVRESIDAYLYLLETICGLKSKLVGENEIVGQFKTAYKEFIKKENRQNQLLKILEKLFKDAKTIRTDYLTGITHKTYASITRKAMLKNAPEEVVILGSGALAEDLINQFKKKTKVKICARNKERLEELQGAHEIEIIHWEHKEALLNHPHLVNTIGIDKVIWDEAFFATWLVSNKENNPYFIDLGSPSCVRAENVPQNFMSLDQVFQEGAIRESKKLEQIELARKAMIDITERRNTNFKEYVSRLNQYNQKMAYETV